MGAVHTASISADPSVSFVVDLFLLMAVKLTRENIGHRIHGGSKILGNGGGKNLDRTCPFKNEMGRIVR